MDFEGFWMYVGMVFGWFLMVLEGFWMGVGWICNGRCMKFCFLCFRDFLILCFFFEVDCTFMAKCLAQFSQRLAGLWQNYSKAVVDLWPCFGKKYGRVYGKGMAKLW